MSWHQRPRLEAGQVGIPRTLFCSTSGMSRGCDLRRPGGGHWAQGHWATFWRPRLTSKGARPEASAPRCRARPQEPGDATPAAKGRRHSPSKEGKASRSQSLSQKVREQCACPHASRPSGSWAGATPQGVGPRTAGSILRHRRGVTDRRGAGERGWWEAPQGGWGRRSACTRRAP